jgi:hypothetical protein
MHHHHTSHASHAPVDESCPSCHSQRTQPRRIAQRWGGALGTLAGAVFGIAAAGASVLSRGSPALRLSYALTSALLGALVTANSGCRSGSKLGRLLDDAVISQWVCQDCGFIFGGPVRDPPEELPEAPVWAR